MRLTTRRGRRRRRVTLIKTIKQLVFDVFNNRITQDSHQSKIPLLMCSHCNTISIQIRFNMILLLIIQQMINMVHLLILYTRYPMSNNSSFNASNTSIDLNINRRKSPCYTSSTHQNERSLFF